MKVGLIQQRVGSTNKIGTYKQNLHYQKINFCSYDEYYTSREDYYQISSGSISNKDINNLVFTKPTGFFYKLNGTQSDISLEYCKVKNIKSNLDYNYYLNCSYSKLNNIENCNNICLFGKSNAENLRRIQYAYLNGATSLNKDDYPKVNSIEADYVSLKDHAVAKYVKSHFTYLEAASKIENNLTTNKLKISKGIFTNTSMPVFIDNANIIESNIKILSNDYNNIDERYIDKADARSLKNGKADIYQAEINNLSCKELTAENCKLKNVKANVCNKLYDTNIETLETAKIESIRNTKIKNLIVTVDKLEYDKIKNSTQYIKFKNDSGILILKNEGNKIPKVDLQNGKIFYELNNFKCDNFLAECGLTATGNVKINNITVTEPDSVVTLIGNTEIKNINFKNGGKVVLKNDSNGKHPDITKINVTNGEVIKYYTLKGFDKVAGMDELKQQLREDVIEPLEKSELYKSYGLDVLNGFLLYGPPGCGKTFIAKQLAEETGRYIVEISPSNIGDKYQHQTAKNIAAKFQEARTNSPSITFIDEVESIAPSRQGLAEWDTDTQEQVTELLQQINNCNNNKVLVICASNEPQKIDSAIKRTGRLDKKIFVGPPDQETRKALFKFFLNNIEKKEDDINIEKLSEIAKYYTAQDIRMLLRQAALTALKNEELVNTEHIINAFKKVPPSLNKKMVEDYRAKGELE